MVVSYDSSYDLALLARTVTKVFRKGTAAVEKFLDRLDGAPQAHDRKRLISLGRLNICLASDYPTGSYRVSL